MLPFGNIQGRIVMNTWDFIVAALIGLIDLNPLWDLVFVPLSWAFLFWA